MRRAEPIRQHAVFRDAIENSVRAYDCSVNCSGEHQKAYDDYERLKKKFQGRWANQIDGDAAD